MKKLIVALSVGALMMGTSAMASEATGPAIHIDDFGCSVYDGTGALVAAEDSKQVLSMDANGNLILKCSSKNVAPTEKKAVKFNNENAAPYCMTAYGLTEDWSNIVTPSGKSMLTCIVHPKQAE